MPMQRCRYTRRPPIKGLRLFLAACSPQNQAFMSPFGGIHTDRGEVRLGQLLSLLKGAVQDQIEVGGTIIKLLGKNRGS